MIQQDTNMAQKEEKEITIRTCLEKLLGYEYLMWAQWARQLWLTKVDRNTKYFDMVVNYRRAKNQINSTQKNGGEWISN